MSSPTGIATEAWIWLRAIQLILGLSTFIAGCVDSAWWVLTFAMLLPMLLINLLLLLDSIIYYKRRYTLGAGRASTLRWITDLIMLLLLAAFIVLILFLMPPRMGDQALSVFLALIVLVSISMAHFTATFIMLCVEDARMRKRAKRALALAASAAQPMPSDQPLYHEPLLDSMPHQAPVHPTRAVELVNNILANGFTIQHLEKMGVPSRPAPMTNNSKRDYEPGPPNYKA